MQSNPLIRRAALALAATLALGLSAAPLEAAPKSYPYKVTTTVGMVNDIG